MLIYTRREGQGGNNGSERELTAKLNRLMTPIEPPLLKKKNWSQKSRTAQEEKYNPKAMKR
jgi:hypothetical protein